ncbi:SurA N-terminal domain-containing protein [Brachymonas sp. G13]|uniref:SurA N-terminal domain-containing protein n=1 Tax=Brachymonas TaxID=28219 RepID=UPI0016A8CA17|nr:SurA N-terminal domain-containing protein [Brachymonas sp. J145]MEE1653169.1 SurA N-terminal domain-containing protein [Brachymonas sp. J145]NLX15704.1 peptidyl-prolyl cis-trans isomerase [Ramlibacter sp.]
MFEFIRKHTKWMMVLLFALIIPSFVFFGIDNYQSMNSAANATVAVVDGQKITQAEWDEAHRQEADRLRASQPGLDSALLDSPQAKYDTLQSMVEERMLFAAANKLKLFVSDQRLARELLNDPTIASLRGPDGKLDEERYKQLLSTQGLTPASYEAMVRTRLSQQQVLGGVIAAGGWMPENSANLVLNPFFERREIQLAGFDPARYASQVPVDDAAVQAFYDAHKDRFRTTEQATVEYVVLDMPAVERTLTVSEQDMRSYYEQNQERFVDAGQRRASHILITVDAAADQATRDAARKRAEELLAQVRQDPSRFAELARANSQDPGSAAQGGDLGFFDRNAMVKPFADAVFGMEKGQISDIVQTDFGYHIIQLTDVQATAQQGFDAHKAEIEAELKQQLAQQKYGELAERLSDGVFRNPAELKTLATELGLQLQTANHVQRTPAPGTQGPLANRNFLQALFAADSISKKQNTQTIEIGSNQLVAGRLVEYHAAGQQALADIKPAVTQAYVQDRAVALAKADAQAKLKEWQANPAAAGDMGETAVISRVQQTLVPPVVDAAMRANTGKLPAFEGVDLGQQGYAIVRVNKVLPADPATDEFKKQQLPQLSRALNEAQLMAYFETLKKLLKVEIKVPKPAAAAAVATS